MKNRSFIRSRTLIVVAAFFTLSSPISWSIENRSITNPAGLSTVPPSSTQSGLISNPNPIDTSGNLVITGNVRRGKHFGDTVPYGSITSFRAGLGSSSPSSFSLSSFLRDSAGAEDFGYYTGKYRVQPYYLRSQTVTTTRPGYSGVFRPGTSINDRTPQGQQLMVERYQRQTQDSRLKTQDSRLKTQDLGTALEQRFVLWSPEHKQGQAAKTVQSAKPDFNADVLTTALTPSQANTVVKGLAFQDRATSQKVTGWEPQADEVKLGEHGRDLQDQHNRVGSDVLERIKRQLDDLTRSIDARMQAIEAASGKMPQSPTVDAAKRAIDDAIAGQ